MAATGFGAPNPFLAGYRRGLSIKAREEQLKLQRERLVEQRKESDLRSRIARFNIERITRSLQQREALERSPEVVEFPDRGEFQPESPTLGGIQMQPAPIGGQLEPREIQAPGAPLSGVSNPFGEGYAVEPSVEGRTMADVFRAIAARRLAESTGTAAVARLRSEGADRRAAARNELAERRVDLAERKAAQPKRPAGLAALMYAGALETGRREVQKRVGIARLKNRGVADVRGAVDEYLNETGTALAKKGVNTGRLRGDLLKVFDVTNPRGSGGSAPRSDAEKEHAAANLAAAGARMTLSAARASRDPVRIRAAEEAYQRAVERLDKARAAFRK